jgi:hypothetical protein
MYIILGTNSYTKAPICFHIVGSFRADLALRSVGTKEFCKVGRDRSVLQREADGEHRKYQASTKRLSMLRRQSTVI